MESQSSVATREPRWRHPGGKLIEEGSQSLKQAELLAILIGSGVPGKSALDIANALLDQYVGLYSLYQKKPSVEDLGRIEGLGRAKAERILAALKIGRLVYARQRFERAQRMELSPFYKAEVERLHQEVDAWDETGLLSSVIGAGVAGRPSRKIAEDVIRQFHSIEGIFGQDLGRLQKIKGLDAVKVIRIAATLEIAVRLVRAFQT